ncbi:MAG TPA: hypothetical protein VI139_00125 [Gemmatimonadales bacterium]|nr:hypothetical protein [Usitatibacter sp.]
MISLFKPFAKLRPPTPDRRPKTPGALYRILSRDFESIRSGDCSCKMPLIVECERASRADANWRVYPIWCQSPQCRRAVSEVVRRNSKLFELIELCDEGLEPAPVVGAGL